MMRNIFTRVKNKIDTAANWTAHDTVLLKGEFGIESDTYRFKIGDGTTTWNNLPYSDTSITNSLTEYVERRISESITQVLNEDV